MCIINGIALSSDSLMAFYHRTIPQMVSCSLPLSWDTDLTSEPPCIFFPPKMSKVIHFHSPSFLSFQQLFYSLFRQHHFILMYIRPLIIFQDQHAHKISQTPWSYIYHLYHFLTSLSNNHFVFQPFSEIF
jgi:hypothetical protein